MRMTRLALAAACGGALLTAAAPASAATLTADRACYVESTGIGLVGAGFVPAAPIQISGEQVALSGAAGPDGGFSATVKAPLLGTIKPATRSFTLTATDTATSTTAITEVQVATAAFSTSTGFKSPRALRAWKFSGLYQQPGKPIYGHFRHGGKTFANYRFGVPKGPCGTLSRRAPGIPSRSIPSGKWTVQIDFSRSYRATTTPRLTGSTTVITTFR